MPIREEIALGAFCGWMVRQLMMVRLYHPGRTLMFLQWLSVACILFGGAGLVAWAAASGARLQLAIVVGALAVYGLAGCLDAVGIERAINRRRAAGGEPQFASRSWIDRLRIPAAVAAAMLVFVVSLAAACFRRQVRWRGVTYEIRGPRRVLMTGFRPFEPHPPAADLQSVL
jgi:hypothetical protein